MKIVRDVEGWNERGGEWPHEVTTTACCGGNTQPNFLPGEPGARMRRTRGAFVEETELLEFNTGCGLETIAMKVSILLF
ncbi:unnamed protein product [Arctogadus glacialis]